VLDVITMVVIGGARVFLIRFRRPSHWNWISDPWVGCL